MKLIKRLLLGFSLLLILLALSFGGLFYFVTRTPKLPPGVTPPPISTEAAARLENKLIGFVQQIEAAQQAKESRPVSLEITEEEINSLIATRLPEIKGQAPIKSIQVYFREGKIKALVQPDLPVVKPIISADFSPETLISEGKLLLIPTNIDIGKLPLPAVIEEQIKRAYSKELEPPINLKEIKVEEGRLIIEGETRTSPAEAP